MEGLPPEKHHASRCKEQHAQKDHSMAPALDVRCPVLSLAIADGNFDDFQAHPRRAKKEIKIAEWVDISKKIPRGGEALIVRSGDDFCAAQCVFETLPEDEGKCDREKFVGQNI